MAEPLTLCVLLWARPGAEEALTAYEDQVLALVPGYGGKVLWPEPGARAPTASRWKPTSWNSPSPQGPRRLREPTAAGQALAAERDRAVARTEIIEVELVPGN